MPGWGAFRTSSTLRVAITLRLKVDCRSAREYEEDSREDGRQDGAKRGHGPLVPTWTPRAGPRFGPPNVPPLRSGRPVSKMRMDAVGTLPQVVGHIVGAALSSSHPGDAERPPKQDEQDSEVLEFAAAQHRSI